MARHSEEIQRARRGIEASFERSLVLLERLGGKMSTMTRELRGVADDMAAEGDEEWTPYPLQDRHR